MKKLLALLLCLCLGTSCGLAGIAEGTPTDSAVLPSLWEDGQIHQVEKKTFPLYIGSPAAPYLEEFPVYLVDGMNDLAYLELNDFAAFLNKTLSDTSTAEDGPITVTVDAENDTVTFVQKAGSMLAFSFKEKKIVWTDYLAFMQSEDALYMNMLRGFKTLNSEGQPQFLEIGNTRERHGSAITLDLGKYGIPMLAQDGLYLVPAQTLAAFCLSTKGVSLYFNQKCLILTNPQEFEYNNVVFAVLFTIRNEVEEVMKSDLPEAEKQAKIVELTAKAQAENPSFYSMYMAGPKGERSAAMADYGWHELCLEMDSLYGLKNAHDVDSFLRYFTETGLLSGLVSRSAEDADQAIWRLTQTWLDDSHSTFYSGSYLSEKEPDNTGIGFSKAGRQTLRERLAAVRAQYPAAVPGYYEVGDTAYLTLDNFSYMFGADHYALAETDELPIDTFGQVIRAHRQITRENSPIKNVVLDLSQNTGGATPAAIYVISWMLGDAQLSVKDTFSGAETTAAYRADVNLDRAFNEQDTLAGRGLNLYCLTSPISFSCGNLVPWAFKAEGSVKLMGSVTGGGSCAVWPMVTAWGTSFAISGPFRLSFLKNGSYYDVDQGVEPDYVIRSFDHYYDREALTAYIDGLY